MVKKARKGKNISVESSEDRKGVEKIVECIEWMEKRIAE